MCSARLLSVGCRGQAAAVRGGVWAPGTTVPACPAGLRWDPQGLLRWNRPPGVALGDPGCSKALWLPRKGQRSTQDLSSGMISTSQQAEGPSQVFDPMDRHTPARQGE